MNFNEEKLDEELKQIDLNTEEGLAKIEEAKKLLPIHYDSLLKDIGGKIEKDLNLDRLPKNIKSMVDIFSIETPALGTQTNVMVSSMVYATMFGKFRPYVRDVLVSKKSDIPTNIFAISLAGSGCVDRDTEFCTPTGWKKICDYEEGDKVLSWNDDGSSQFDTPTVNIHMFHEK